MRNLIKHSDEFDRAHNAYDTNNGERKQFRGNRCSNGG